MKKRINITVDDGLIKKFVEYCKKNGMKVSSRIELLISSDLKKVK
jgi:hypothetical protein